MTQYPLDFSNTAIAFQSLSDSSIRRAYWLFWLMRHPALVRLASSLGELALRAGLPVEPVLKATMFRHFCGGETIEGCEPTVKRLARSGVGSVLDYSVEGMPTEEGLDAASDEIRRTIERAKGDARFPFCVFKVSGLARFELLAKRDEGEALSEEEKQEWDRVQARVQGLCALAHRLNQRLFIDAEETWVQNSIDELAERMMAQFNQKQPIVYHTVQMYRWDRIDYLRRLQAKAQAEGFVLGLKLVRGAYLDKENARAERLGYPSPLYRTKQETDAAYDEAVRFCIEHLERISFCAGTHNEISTHRLIEMMEKNHIPNTDPRVYFCQLLGMSDHLTFNLAHSHFNAAKYVPYGPVKAVFPYLVRRAQENTSIQGQMGRELMLLAKERARRSGQPTSSPTVPSGSGRTC